MSLNDLIRLAGNGVPGLDAAVTIVSAIYTRVQDVKVYRQQCRDLASRCCSLLVAVQESHTDDMDNAEARGMVDEIDATVSRIQRRVDEWAAYSRVKSLLNLNDIKDGIDSFYKDLDSCFKKFNVKINVELVKGQRELAAIQASDRAELREMLQNIAMSVDELRTLQRMQSPATAEIMENIEEELDDPGLEASQQVDLQRGLSQIREHVTPTMTDLTGQVEKVSEHPVLRGRLNDIFVGKWAGGKKVALRLPRGLMTTRRSQTQFENEVGIWRGLQHPNITRLYGVAYFENHAYMVSHWMENGDAITYIQNFPDIDRLRLLSEVASGMEYLHSSNIVHGSLCGVNVLISKRGKACLSDFGFAKVLEKFGREVNSIPGTSNTRWNAPELLERAGEFGRSKVSTSMSTDVWSFGMLCLELMTGQHPFKEVVSDDAVAEQLTRGELPPRPGSLETSRGLTDGLWALMLRCWSKHPQSRPSMTKAKARISGLREDFVAPSSSSSIISPTQTHVELVPDLAPLLLQRKTSHASSSGSSSIWSKTRRPSSSSGVLSRLKPWRSQTSPQWDDSTQITPTTSLSSTLPEITIPKGDGFVADVEKSYSRAPVLSQPKKYGLNVLTTPPPSILSVTSPGASTSSGKSSPILRRKDDFIEAATLEDMIKELVTDSSYAGNAREYKDVFLTTYEGFTTANDVFQILVDRFHNATSDPQQHTHLRVNTIALMKYWVTNPRIKVSTNVLSQIKEFAMALASSEQMAKKMIELAEDLLVVTERHIQSSYPSSLQLPTSPDIVEPSPEELAKALVVLQGEDFARILPADFISHLRQPEKNNSIKTATETNKKIINWVQLGIMSSKKLENRSLIFKFFVNTAEKSRELRNFASMSAIVSALQSVPITSLDLTYDRLPPDAKRKLTEMSGILKPDDNHSAYKESLKRSKNKPCIPWLAVHMDEMRTMFEAQDTIEEGGTRLINFAKWTTLHDCIREVLQHKSPDVSGYRQKQAAALAYLQQQIQGISIRPEFDEVLKNKSSKLAADEDVLRRLGIPRLHAVGIS